ncbi:MAG: glycosyltransferase family 2 protein [Cellvibrionaceae bacterium]
MSQSIADNNRSENDWRPVIIIPVYNHEKAVGVIVKQLLRFELPIILVDDGSTSVCRLVLEELSSQYQHVSLVSLVQNLGKGGAVKAGLRDALAKNYTHGLQIDADGQHAISDVEKFLSLAKKYPDVLIAGCPLYDETVPALRFYSRYLTHVWIHINTLSLSIKDSMCGFRVYPVEKTCGILDEEFTGNRMDFDPEILVRWHWRLGRVLNVPTKVSYPLDGVSHFALWKDNYLITKMHTRLFFGMLLRSPKLISRLVSRQFGKEELSISQDEI